MSDYNPALAFIGNSVKDAKKKESTLAMVKVAEKIPVPVKDPAPVVKPASDTVLKNVEPSEAMAVNNILLVSEPRNRRFQALFKPSVFKALEEYGKANKISVNEALEQMILTKKHI